VNSYTQSDLINIDEEMSFEGTPAELANRGLDLNVS
jgi:hypothetical protein